MIDDIQGVLKAWGAWCRSDLDRVGHKNNWGAILAAAPKLEDEEVPTCGIRWELFINDKITISDKQGAKIDRIITLIAKHAPAHAKCLVLKYVHGEIPVDIARGYLTSFLYGDSGKRAGEHRVREYIAHTEGLIMGMLMDDI